MTPHLSEDPWTGVALGLERLTGIKGIVLRHVDCEGNVDSARARLAVQEIAKGRVKVPKRWLAQLVREMPWDVLPELGLYDTYEQAVQKGNGNSWSVNLDSSAAYWAEQIETGLLVPEGVQMKKDKNEG